MARAEMEGARRRRRRLHVRRAAGGGRRRLHPSPGVLVEVVDDALESRAAGGFRMDQGATVQKFWLTER